MKTKKFKVIRNDRNKCITKLINRFHTKGVSGFSIDELIIIHDQSVLPYDEGLLIIKAIGHSPEADEAWKVVDYRLNLGLAGKRYVKIIWRNPNPVYRTPIDFVLQQISK